MNVIVSQLGKATLQVPRALFTELEDYITVLLELELGCIFFCQYSSITK